MTLRVLVCMLLSIAATAQPEYRFHNYTLAEGLPGPNVRDITEDVYGQLWLATNNGLASFNGSSFTTFRKGNGQHSALATNDVTKVYPLPTGDLLVGTTEGLHYFNHRTQTFTFTWDSLPPSYISSIVPDAETGVYWVGSSTGLYKLGAVGQTPVEYFPDPAHALNRTGIFSMYNDQAGNLWMTTSRKGFFKLDLATGAITNYRHQPDNVRSISSDVMRQMVALPDGRLVLGTAEAGFNIFDPRTETCVRYNHDPTQPTSLSGTAAFALLVASTGELWIGTWASGLNVFDTSTFKGRSFKSNPDDPYALPGNNITTLFESRSGELWIGSGATGLSRLSPAEQQFLRYRHRRGLEQTLSNPYVRSIYEDEEGRVWLGTNQGGLNQYNPTTQQYTVYLRPDGTREQLARGSIWSICESKSGDLWLGTTRGVARLNVRTGAVQFTGFDANDPKKLSGNNVMDVVEDPTGSLWVGIYYAGLDRIDLATGVVQRFKSDAADKRTLSSNNVTAVFLDSRQRLWVGSDHGLNLLDRATGTFTRYLMEDETSVIHLSESAAGELLVATDRGLKVLNIETGVTETHGESSGLPTDQINSVLEDAAGYWWIGSNLGVTRYDPRTREVIHLDEFDGLSARDTEGRACYKSRHGLFYFGGTGGVTAFNPLTILPQRPAPPVYFTQLSVFNKTIPVHDSSLLTQNIATVEQVTLQHTDYVFALEFAAVEYRVPHRIRYAYRLQGFDQDWIYTDARDRKAVYTNVPPGTYTLEVRASDAYGRFPAKATALSIVVTPPWWKTWWALMLFYGSGVLLVVLIFRARLAFIRKQNQVLEQQVAARTAEVHQQRQTLQIQAEALEKANLQKSKLFSIIAHDLKSPLHSLKALLTLMDPGILTSEDLERMRRDIGSRVDVISGAMENLLGWARGQLELETLQPEPVDLGRVLHEMHELYQPIAAKKEIEVVVRAPVDLVIHTDLNVLRAILRNLTSNSIKFTASGGRVTLTAGTQGDEVLIEVTDTGVGMTQQQLDTLFSVDKRPTLGTGGERGVGLGLQVVQDFVAKLKGRLQLESQPGVGSTFRVVLKR